MGKHAIRALIVEDNQDIMANLFTFLEGKGYELDCAYDGRQGLRLALSGGFDVVVLDVMLPGMDGVTLCRKLRTSGLYNSLLHHSRSQRYRSQ